VTRWRADWWVACAVVLAACGGAQPPPSEPAPGPGPASDGRTPIERRRDAACDQLGPRLTACAVEDARAELAAGKIKQADFDRDTAPEIQRKNTEAFGKSCKGSKYTSRQVRVLEVCFREERACAPLLDCLDHLRDAER
jgi:hypothetical protein